MPLRLCAVLAGLAIVAGPAPCEGQNPAAAASAGLDWIKVSSDRSHFVKAGSGERFVIWGVNYDHDGPGRLIEDYWHDEWENIEQDFREIRDLNANVVRVHLQLGRFMSTPTEPDDSSLKQLARLLTLAEETGLYLDLTGLGCYHKADIPTWYDQLGESDRWAVQVRFWQAVAGVCRDSPAVFCYDLMNEPILAGNKPETDWLAGELGGKYFVQRITLDLAGRTREEVAAAWVSRLTDAIREVDNRHLITVGVIPWALTFRGAKPLFYAPEVGEPFDFVSVHFYPERDQIDKAVEALKVYDVGKPLVIEEMFPLKCGNDQMQEFITRSAEFTDGWISFYWGTTIEENESAGDLKGALVAAWLKHFKDHSPLLRP